MQEQQAIDEYKQIKCTAHGIALITVPQIDKLISRHDLPPYILGECQRMGIDPPTNYSGFKVDLRDAYATNGSKEAINELCTLAAQRGGACLSTEYRGSLGTLRWRCRKGHEWEATAQSIRQGYWCRKCSMRKRRPATDEVKDYAISHCGEFLGFVYEGGKTKLQFRCRHSHEWLTIWNNCRRGSWCRKCSGKHPLNISIFNKIAEQHGGKCLSTKYRSNESILEFECVAGHQWSTKALIVRRGSWCPHCAKTHKQSG